MLSALSFFPPPALAGIHPSLIPLGFSHQRPLNSTGPLEASFAGNACCAQCLGLAIGFAWGSALSGFAWGSAPSGFAWGSAPLGLLGARLWVCLGLGPLWICMSSALGLLGARPPLGLLGLNARVGALDWNPSGLGSGFPWGSALDSFEARRWLAMAANGWQRLRMVGSG